MQCWAQPSDNQAWETEHLIIKECCFHLNRLHTFFFAITHNYSCTILYLNEGLFHLKHLFFNPLFEFIVSFWLRVFIRYIIESMVSVLLLNTCFSVHSSSSANHCWLLVLNTFLKVWFQFHKTVFLLLNTCFSVHSLNSPHYCWLWIFNALLKVWFEL